MTTSGPQQQGRPTSAACECPATPVHIRLGCQVGPGHHDAGDVALRYVDRPGRLLPDQRSRVCLGWDSAAGQSELHADLHDPALTDRRLWRLLEKQDGPGWVTAGKSLARKRPSLIPVYDNVARCTYGWPLKFWMAMREALQQDEGNFLSALYDLKRRAGVPCSITPLRVLDAAVWMRHQPVHSGHRCGGMS